MNFLKLFVVLIALGAIAMASSTILVLDASGSMDEYGSGASSSMRKIDIAKSAANTFLDNVKSGDEVALIVYYDCDDIQTVVSFTTDMSTIKSKISGVEPDSYTPIARAITYADTYASTSGRTGANVILLSDGEETCDSQSDAVSAASSAVASNIKIVNVVGLGIDSTSTAYTNLQEIATAGKGKYYGASDVSTLTSSLNQAYNSGGDSCCMPAGLLTGVVAAAVFFSRRK